jgi:polysaccharide biosynthesis transport protein
MGLRDFLRAVRRNWITLVALLLAGVIFGSAYTLLQTPKYEAHAQAFVSTGSTGSVSDLNQGGAFAQQAVTSYASLAVSPYVLERVVKDLGLHETAGVLANAVTATAPSDTVVIDITALDASPARAAAIANSVTKNLTSAVATVTQTRSTASVRVTQIERAFPPSTPSSPRLALNLALGLLIGLAIGVLATVLREVLDTRLRGLADLHQVSKLPLLGTVYQDRGADANPLVLRDRQHNPRAEAYRALRTNLQFLEFAAESRMIVVTSSIPGEGKSTTAANLALAIADTGQNVLIVDADLRRPRVAKYFGIDGTVGLVDTLIGTIDLAEAVQSWGANGLKVLPSGPIPPNPSELLQSQALSALLDKLRTEFDTVIFDASPLLPVPDAAILSRQTSGALVVAAARRVRKPQLRTALGNLERVGARTLGIALTMVPLHGADAYKYGYGYSSYAPAAADGERGSAEGAPSLGWVVDS